jgi:hypothetical protein
MPDEAKAFEVARAEGRLLHYAELIASQRSRRVARRRMGEPYWTPAHLIGHASAL